MTEAESSLLRIWSARDRIASLDPTSDKLPSAREDLAEAMHSLLCEVSATDMAEVERRSLDAALSPHAADLKSALLKALRVCMCARGLLGLPALMEETRKLLCAAPAKGVATYLEQALCADIDNCSQPRALAAVRDLMHIMTGTNPETGTPRLKKELGGHLLPTSHKKSCRTALNKAVKALDALEAASREAQQARRPPPRVEMERDVRLDDAEDAARRTAAHQAGMDTLFGDAGLPTALPVIEMPEGSLREMRLEDAHRAAASSMDVLVEQALSDHKRGKAKATAGKAKDQEGQGARREDMQDPAAAQ